MKRVVLSLAVVAGSAAYIVEKPSEPHPVEAFLAAPAEEAPQAGDDLPSWQSKAPGPPPGPGALAKPIAAAPVVQPPAPQATVKPLASASEDEEDDSGEDEIGASVARLIAEVPLPQPHIIPPAPRARPAVAKAAAPVVRVAAATRPATHADGTFVGSVENAYYGLVQVQAEVAQGKLVAIKVLRYPSDRRTSVYINSRALPVLRREAIAAQSARVDIVSGATLTSRAFARSLDAALNHAGA